jgi:hypothetical protein
LLEGIIGEQEAILHGGCDCLASLQLKKQLMNLVHAESFDEVVGGGIRFPVSRFHLFRR